MSKDLVTSSTLVSIANAIRAKLGVGTLYKPGEMPAAIASIETPDLEALSVTENGSYTPTSPKNGFSSVSVAVPAPFTASVSGNTVVITGTAVSVSGNEVII